MNPDPNPSPIKTYTDDDLQYMQQRDVIAGTIGHALHRTYPRTSWVVEVYLSRTGATAIIKVPQISASWGMVIDIPATKKETEQYARKAGGELLERFRIARNQHHSRQSEDDMKSLPQTIQGEVPASLAKKGELPS